MEADLLQSSSPPIKIDPDMSLKEFLETFFPEYKLTPFDYMILEAYEDMGGLDNKKQVCKLEGRRYV